MDAHNFRFYYLMFFCISLLYRYPVIMSNANDPNYYGYGHPSNNYGWGDGNQGDGISFDMDSNFGQEQLVCKMATFD